MVVLTMKESLCDVVSLSEKNSVPTFKSLANSNYAAHDWMIEPIDLSYIKMSVFIVIISLLATSNLLTEKLKIRYKIAGKNLQ